jgi:hypothetical protein
LFIGGLVCVVRKGKGDILPRRLVFLRRLVWLARKRKRDILAGWFGFLAKVACRWDTDLRK